VHYRTDAWFAAASGSTSVHACMHVLSIVVAVTLAPDAAVVRVVVTTVHPPQQLRGLSNDDACGLQLAQ
jgi:hypothetical protein